MKELKKLINRSTARPLDSKQNKLAYFGTPNLGIGHAARFSGHTLRAGRRYTSDMYDKEAPSNSGDIFSRY